MAGITAEDYGAVWNLIAQYAFSIDLEDIEGFIGLWAEDAVLESGSGRAEGHDGLRAWYRARAERVAGEGERSCHFSGLPRIRGEGDTATAMTYCSVMRWNPERGIRVNLVGRYEDTFSKIDGEWRFQTRAINGEL